MGLKYVIHRSDANQGEIVKALRKCGVKCWTLGGRGRPDLLTYWHGRYLPLEVKTEKGELRESQKDAPWPVVRSFEEACIHIGVKA